MRFGERVGFAVEAHDRGSTKTRRIHVTKTDSEASHISTTAHCRPQVSQSDLPSHPAARKQIVSNSIFVPEKLAQYAKE